jgi:hypothetical protein
MNYSNLFVLGLLLLTANLSMGALFSPSHVGRTSTDRLVLLWKILLLAAIQIGAWAIVLHQGGAAPTLLLAFSRATACFALVGGSGGGLAAPWGEIAPFIALNSPLYILLSLLSLTRGNATAPEAPLRTTAPPPQSSLPAGKPETVQPMAAKVSPATGASPVAEKESPKTIPLPKLAVTLTSPVSSSSNAGASQNAETTAHKTPAGPANSASVASAKTTSAPQTTSAPEPDFKPGGFRATIPKAASFNAQLSPEEELAEQMKPVGPTPPPIRFEWKN